MTDPDPGRVRTRRPRRRPPLAALIVLAGLSLCAALALAQGRAAPPRRRPASLGDTITPRSPGGRAAGRARGQRLEAGGGAGRGAELRRGLWSVSGPVLEVDADDGPGPDGWFVAQADEAAVLFGGGLEVLAPFGPGAFLVRGGPGAAGELSRRQGVGLVMPFSARFIVDPRLSRAAIAAAATPGQMADLQVQAGVVPGFDADAVARQLEALGVSVEGVEADAGAIAVLRLRLPAGALAPVIAGVPGLLRLELAAQFTAANEEMAATVQRGEFVDGRLPLRDAGVDGGGGGMAAGQLVAITDTGVSYDAAHLSDTETDAGTPGAAHTKLHSLTAVGSGDLLSCDAAGSGGSTHGNIVAGVIAGNVSRFGLDLRNNPGWSSAFTDHPADGVAPGARLVFQDAQAVGACVGSFGGVSPGNLFTRMTEARALGARIHNLSFSDTGNLGSYTLDAINVDRFLRAQRDYLAVAAVGNEGADFDGDGNYEFGSITPPGTAKNALSVGASNSANEPINPFDPKEALSPGVPNDGVNLLSVFANGSTGRGFATAPGRVKPEVMAPGQDVFPNLRLDGAVACRSSDNDNDSTVNGVECLLDDDNDGTSFAAAGVSGAAALVRDYFAQGLGDDGIPGGPPVGTLLSGAAVKAVLIASTEFMRVSPGFNFDLVQPRFDVPDLQGRFNYEQGYGRVNLSLILPLYLDAGSPSGLILEDQGLSGGLLQGQVFSRTITVLDAEQELRVAMVWMDPPDLAGGGLLINDLDLEVVDHGPDNMLGTGDDVLYRGNFFTEDQGDFDGQLVIFDPNVPSIPGEDADGDGIMDESEFSLPVTPGLRDYHDRFNPGEAVMLSPDPDRDGSTADGQLFSGRQYTARVSAYRVSSPFETIITAGPNLVLNSSPSGDDFIQGSTIDAGADGIADTTAAGDDIQVVAPGQSSPQPFALVMGGGLVNTSAIRLSASRFLCNDLAGVTVLDPTPGLLPAAVSMALTVEVRNSLGAVIDAENALVLTQDPPGSARFTAQSLPTIDGVAAVANDGILSVSDGGELVAIYADADGPLVQFQARVSCRPSLALATISAPGANLNFSILGGCDAPRRRDPRGFLVGFRTNPQGDIFLDADERLTYSVAILNQELEADLIDAVATLRAVLPDGDNATDPDRLNNTPADSGPQRRIRLLHPQRDVGLVPRGTLQSVTFDLEVEPDVAFPDEIEMVFGVSARRNGLPVEFVSVFRHVLNTDSETFAFSTDYPLGGSETRVYAGELFNPLNPDLAAESFVFEDATTIAFGGGNPQWAGAAPGPKAPWTFDLSNEGFSTSRRFDSSIGVNLELNLNLWHWAPTGDCGFQSNDPGQLDPAPPVPGMGGIWHTGTIGTNAPETARKLANGRTGFDLGCEDYDIPNDASTPLNEQVMDVLSSPVFHRVHVNPDANGFEYTLEFSRFAFNNQMDIADANVTVGWELDPDFSTPDPVDPLDFSWLNVANSARGFLSGVSQIPYPTFDPNNPHAPGTLLGVGPQGRGSIGSFRDPNDLAKAPSRSLGEVGGTGFGTLQLRGAGGLPLRNVEEILDGFYGGNTTFEDLFGPNENNRAVPPIRRDDFQVNFAMFVRENANPAISTVPSYGMGVDDVVVEWVEHHPVEDVVPCATLNSGHPQPLGSCARILWDRAVVYESEDSAVLSVLDPDAAFGPDGEAGTGDEQAVDSDSNGFLEVVARVFSDVDLAGEIVRLEQVQLLSPVYQEVVQLSSTTGLNSSVDGVIYMQQNGDGTNPVVIVAQYNDDDDGTGAACPDNPIKALMTTQFVGGNILFVSAQVTDLNGDLDGIPDDQETVRLDLQVVSNMLDSADNPVVLENTRIFLSSTDPDVGCISDNVAAYGDLVPGVVTANPPGDAFEFVVNDVGRISASQFLRARFSLGISGTFVDIAGRRRVVSSFATPQLLELNLDLDKSGTPVAAPVFVENWDSVPAGGDGINSFTSGALYPINDVVTVDGSRCQYHDPDGPNANGGGRDATICRPWSGSDWNVMNAGNAPAPKAFSGDASLHMGTHEAGLDASFDSYTTGQLSAATSPTLHMGVSGGSTLSFRHIIALADSRSFGVPSSEAADRAVVQVAQVDPLTGVPLTPWEALPAFQNNYSSRGTDAFINCKFDPVDDFYDTLSAIPGAQPSLPRNSDGVSSEDDYFDPNDPERRLGPSSTCAPQFVFSFMGDWTSSNPMKSGNAFVPGATGSLGSGVWVESIFNLDRYSAQSIRLRLLSTGIELNGPSGARWAGFFGNQLGNATRGWVVDDFTVTGLVASPLQLLVDAKPPPPSTCPVDPNPGTLANEAACNVASAQAGPDLVSPAPGFLVTMDGSASSLDTCVDGFIEYRWRLNGRIVQDWSNEPLFRDNPTFSSAYLLDVRCSVDPACADTSRITVTMGGNLREVSQDDLSQLQVSHLPPRILTGLDGEAQTLANPVSDDVQETPVGQAGAVAVSSGNDGILQSVAAGDDVLERHRVSLDWGSVGAGFGYDVQFVDVQAVQPIPLRLDPAAMPTATLPASRLCRLAQTGDSTVTFLEETLEPATDQVMGFLINSRRLSDSVLGNLGAGLAADGTRRGRPAPSVTACP